MGSDRLDRSLDDLRRQLACAGGASRGGAGGSGVRTWLHRGQASPIGAAHPLYPHHPHSMKAQSAMRSMVRRSGRE
jgi:hypothetical protein